MRLINTLLAMVEDLLHRATNIKKDESFTHEALNYKLFDTQLGSVIINNSIGGMQLRYAYEFDFEN